MFLGKKNAKGAKYFRGKEPLRIVFQENYECRSGASRREKEIKKLPRQEKQLLIEKFLLD